MTYPVDDAGNVRVDFVWGHMPMQPDQQRVNTGGEDENITTDGNWTVIKETGSSTLIDGWDSLSFPTGDGGNTRTQTFEWGNHDMITEGYSNYPSFIPNYAGDQDPELNTYVTVPVISGVESGIGTGLGIALAQIGLTIGQGTTTTRVGATVANHYTAKTQNPPAGAVVISGTPVDIVFYEAPYTPNVVGLTEVEATTALTDAGLVKGTVTTADNAAGATSENNGLVKTQTPAANTLVNAGSTVALVKYAYTVPVGPNYNIAGIRPAPGIGDTGRYLYLNGGIETHGINAQDLITLVGTGVENYNRQFTVFEIYPNDSFNTGGTRVTITNVAMDGTGGDVTNVGTYTKP